MKDIEKALKELEKALKSNDSVSRISVTLTFTKPKSNKAKPQSK